MAFEFALLSGFVVIYAFLLICLRQVASSKLAFRFGFLTGFLVFAPQLAWFWRIFGAASLCLWAVLSAFTGVFVLLLHLWHERYGTKHLWLAAGLFWTGLEFFRSELYFLRFSWLSAGYVFSGNSGLLPIGALGVYGSGLLVFISAGLAATVRRRNGLLILILTEIFILLASTLPVKERSGQRTNISVAGMQLEFPPDLKVTTYLDRLISTFPNANLLVLSEYSFDGPIPSRVRNWCKAHNKYLIAGGKEDGAEPGQFYNTAFVVGPSGEIVFQQGKSVPIQFFKDGQAARSQKVWKSPLGKIAICICYDMSYRTVVDRFMRQGAQAMIVPFMDVSDWGEKQHKLHSKIGPIRAQEYRVPVFRVGSSGISQLIDSTGHILETAPFPGDEAMIGGELLLGEPARIPWDAVVAPFCVLLTAGFISWSAFLQFKSCLGKSAQTNRNS